MKWLVVLTILFAAARGEARTATGYREGEKLKIKVVDVGGAEVEAKTAIAFRAMAKAARKAGLSLAIRSGFRTHKKQTKLYEQYQKGEGNLAARPGFSNHESGRALDLVITDYEVFSWLQGHAATYGFHRTVPGEAWHWEYLGGYHPEPQRTARRAHRSR
jgi:LAS superfamily LD-carboxypeptidase LdcB